MRYAARLGLALLLLTGLTLLGAPSARASCVAEPVVSPHAFTGTVLTTVREGRVAEVRTDDGRIVEVVGTPAAGPGAFTTVDRTYAPGTRYEFHPLDAASPYDDNACTATRPLPPLAPAGTEAGPARSWPEWVAVAGVGAGMVAGVVAGAAALRRRRGARGPAGRAHPGPGSPGASSG